MTARAAQSAPRILAASARPAPDGPSRTEGRRRNIAATHFAGGCHCNAVRFVVRTNKRQLVDCNCSICKKKGYLHLIVPKAEFELVRGQEELGTYEFNTGIAKHYFCKTCGIHPFYTPRSHPDGVSVNARCLDDVDLSAFEIQAFDGAHWEQHVHEIR